MNFGNRFPFRRFQWWWLLLVIACLFGGWWFSREDSPQAFVGGNRSKGASEERVGVGASGRMREGNTARKRKALESGRKINFDQVKIEVDQAEAYLDRYGRTSGSLLAAFRATEQIEFLREAAARFPEDPRIQYFLALREQTTEARLAALEKFRQMDPQNALGVYMRAGISASGDKPDLASILEDLKQAASMPSAPPEDADVKESYKQMGEFLGLSMGETAMGFMASENTQADLMLVRISGVLANAARNQTLAKSEGSYDEVARKILTMKRPNASAPRTIIQDVMMRALEKRALGMMDPQTIAPGSSLTVRERLEELQQQQEQTMAMTQQANELLNGLSESEARSYIEKIEEVGELEALSQLSQQRRAKITPPPSP